jgi:hypothetical protein
VKSHVLTSSIVTPKLSKRKLGQQLTFPIHVLKRQGPREMVNQGRGEQGEKRVGEGQDHRLPIAIAREVRPPVGRSERRIDEQNNKFVSTSMNGTRWTQAA